MGELLKQPQFSPLTVGEQVITIFLGLGGLLDDIAIKNVAKFSQAFIQRLKAEHGDYIEEINTSGNFSDELSAKITEEVKKFKEANKLIS